MTTPTFCANACTLHGHGPDWLPIGGCAIGRVQQHVTADTTSPFGIKDRFSFRTDAWRLRRVIACGNSCHFIAGHVGRLGTRADMVLYQQYMNDIIDGVRKALATVDPTPYFAKYGNNVWAASQQYLAAVVAYASGPVIKSTSGS